jgi:hypothetical protein
MFAYANDILFWSSKGLLIVLVELSLDTLDADEESPLP